MMYPPSSNRTTSSSPSSVRISHTSSTSSSASLSSSSHSLSSDDSSFSAPSESYSFFRRSFLTPFIKAYDTHIWIQKTNEGHRIGRSQRDKTGSFRSSSYPSSFTSCTSLYDLFLYLYGLVWYHVSPWLTWIGEWCIRLLCLLVEAVGAVMRYAIHTYDTYHQRLLQSGWCHRYFPRLFSPPSLPSSPIPIRHGSGSSNSSSSSHSSSSSSSFPLTQRDRNVPTMYYPVMRKKRKKFTLVLDLDETLVHTTDKCIPYYDCRIEIHTKRASRTFYILKRPFLDLFLTSLSESFELVIFTASIRRYADAVIDLIDMHSVIERRFFRQACIKKDGQFIKDLSLIARDLKKVIILDNSPAAYAMHPENAVPISTWYDDMLDTSLRDVIPFLLALRSMEDVRSLLRRRMPFPATLFMKA